MKKKRRVILDSNFLFVPSSLKIDIFEEIENIVGRFEPIVLSVTLQELKKLANSKSEKMRKEASFALDLARKCVTLNVQRKKWEKNDDVIVRIAKETGCPVATNDRDLRKKLRKEGIATIYVREKKYLNLEGEIP